MLLKNNEYYVYGWRDNKDKHNHYFNMELHKELLGDYLESKPTNSRWACPTYFNSEEKESELCWGVHVYEYIESYIDYVL